MKHYIDADRLKEQIQGLINLGYDKLQGNLYHVLNLIDSLQQEQPEVDLEKEYQEFCKDNPFPWSSQYVNREYIDELCLSVARHFYKLGLNARKEDK